MTAFTRGRAGPPDSGTYAVGDTCTDNQGVKFLCVAAGNPGSWVIDASATAGVDAAITAALATHVATASRVAALPTAAVGELGKIYLLIDGNVTADTMHICTVTDSAGPTYGWKAVTIA